jgi:hypothetical protein
MKNTEKNTLLVSQVEVNYTKIVTKKSGEEIKLVARFFNSPFIPFEKLYIPVEVYKKVGEKWVMCKDYLEGDQSFKGIDHYLKNQRPEHLRVAEGPGIIIKTIQEFKQLISVKTNLFKKIKDELHSLNNGRYTIEFNYKIE